jgi:hypothetical protein
MVLRRVGAHEQQLGILVLTEFQLGLGFYHAWFTDKLQLLLRECFATIIIIIIIIMENAFSRCEWISVYKVTASAWVRLPLRYLFEAKEKTNFRRETQLGRLEDRFSVFFCFEVWKSHKYKV